MSYALIEVEATARKAARGAGHSWGMAEEASKAARWLCAAGLDGCAALTLALTVADETAPHELAPVGLGGEWYSEGGTLCPLMAGAALSDAAELWKGDGVRMKNVIAPVLLVPFAAGAAQALGANVRVDWDGVNAVTNGMQISLKIARDASLFDAALLVSVQVGGTMDQPQPRHSRAHPQAADWITLSTFAQRIYAPVTEESRLKGAGAGVFDND